ncbi:MAG: DMT family transporter [Pseudomonadota bacterium]
MTRETAATLLLYIAAVLVWGTTWIMMKYQLGEVAPAASLTYRYLAAGSLILAGAALVGKRVRLTRTEHGWCALQGLCMFSVNYWLTYLAAAHLTTGIVSVFFAGAAAVTMVMSAALTRRLPSLRAIIGAMLGIAGIALVFWPEVAEVAHDGPEIWAGAIVVVSVTLFSAGGLIGARNLASGQPRYGTIGWGMLYGGMIMAVLTLARGETFGFSLTPAYIWSLLWLTLLGSGAVFVLYFAVIERIGAEKASYATVMFPLVALVVSTFAEGYTWPGLALIGVPLALIGNGLVLWQGRSR